MFSIGLKFSIRRLMRVLPSAGLTSLIEISVMIWLGYTAAQFMGWTHLESIFAGAIVAFSSTMISSKALADHVTDERLTRTVYSILVVQDLVAVLLVAILTPVAAGANLSMTGLMITSGSLFGFLAVLLVATGLYGTLAYRVSMRTAEIGVRMAVGARRGQVVWMILQDSLLLTAIGVALGIPLAMLVGRALTASLYGVKPMDAVSYFLAVAGVCTVALAASIIPATRAASVDPLKALRTE